MHEDLLGYLLGALEPHEMDRVRRALEDDPQLQAELARLREMLRPLEEGFSDPAESALDAGAAGSLNEPWEREDWEREDWEREDWEREDWERTEEESTPAESTSPPPDDLISRTMAAIPDGPPPGSEAAANETSISESGLSPVPVQPEAGGWSGWDLMLSGLAAIALFGIVLPGILRGRFIARNIACQDNLRDAGVALTYFALQNPQQQLPQLASEGNEAFAGLFSVKLRDKELIQRMDQLLCPSLDRPELLFERPPTTDQVRAAEGAALRAMQQFSGGSYAYNLGVMSENRYQSPRYQGRTAFAILGDAPVPIASLPNFSASEGAAANRRGGALQATSVGHQPVRYGHGGRGVNLLFEDGHVIFLPVGDAMMTHDHPFLNHRGDIEAGVNIDDATLAPSAYPPFADVQQR